MTYGIYPGSTPEFRMLHKAAEWHEIEALEDGTVFVNVFSEGKY